MKKKEFNVIVGGYAVVIMAVILIVMFSKQIHNGFTNPITYAINNTVSVCTPTAGGGDVCVHTIEPAGGR